LAGGKRKIAKHDFIAILGSESALSQASIMIDPQLGLQQHATRLDGSSSVTHLKRSHLSAMSASTTKTTYQFDAPEMHNGVETGLCQQLLPPHVENF
jgi:hypothetical protein